MTISVTQNVNKVSANGNQIAVQIISKTVIVKPEY